MIFLNHINNTAYVMLLSLLNQVGTHRGAHLFNLDHLHATLVRESNHVASLTLEPIKPASGKRKLSCGTEAEMLRAEKRDFLQLKEWRVEETASSDKIWMLW